MKNFKDILKTQLNESSGFESSLFADVLAERTTKMRMEFLKELYTEIKSVQNVSNFKDLKYGDLPSSFQRTTFEFEYSGAKVTGEFSISGYSILMVVELNGKKESTPNSKSMKTLKQNLDKAIKNLSK